jgi:hypothetical protein
MYRGCPCRGFKHGLPACQQSALNTRLNPRPCEDLVNVHSCFFPSLN